MRRPGVASLIVAAGIASVASVGRIRSAGAAPDDALASTMVVFARGGSLYMGDAKGKTENQLVTLPANKQVRALRTDAAGLTLLADIGGKWSWMPLDGKATRLVELPCAEGPAQLSAEGTCVLCRNPKDANRSIIVQLRANRVTPMDIPTVGSRIAKTAAGRQLVWADANGVWAAPPADPRRRQKVAPESPLRSFLPSPDGTRALGVYNDTIFEGRQKKPAQVLMMFSLDGAGARRKSIREGVPVEWSHDGEWILVQNGAQACIVKASGGQYKCWKGYTAASIAPDGKYALVLGNRDSDKRDKSDKQKSKTKNKKESAKQAPTEEVTAPEGEPEVEGDDDGVQDDVAVPLPTGPLALYRVKLDGPFTDAPALVVRVVDGAAVWIPSK